MSEIDDAFAAAEEKKRLYEEQKLREGLNLSEREFETFKQTRDSYDWSLFDVNEILDDRVVGEYTTRMSTFTIFILSKIPTYMSGPSAGGKTVLMDACIDCLMPGDGVLIEGGSDKVIFEMQRDIRNAKYVVITEINKVNPMVVEIFKSWGEGKTFEYKRAKVQGGYANFVLDCKPFIFSRADESADLVDIGAEFRSRLIELTVDGSQGQTESIMDRQAENVENPFDIKRVDHLRKACLRWHISNLPEYDVYVNPAAGILREYIPTVFTTARRDFPKYLKNTEGIARFYYKNRMSVTISGQRTLFVTPQDMFLNHFIFGTSLVQSALRCSPLEKGMLRVIDKEGESTKQHLQRYLRIDGVNSTLKNIENHLKHLVDIGYVNVEKPGKENLYSVSDLYKEIVEINPNFKDVIEYAKNTMQTVEHYQPYADEYIARFCSPDSMIVQNPITGESINILEYDFSRQDSVGVAADSTRIQKPPAGQLRLFEVET